MFPSPPARPATPPGRLMAAARGARPRPGRLQRQRRALAGGQQLDRDRDRGTDRHAARRRRARRPPRPSRVTLTDDEGTAVTLAAEPKKIVSLTPAATEILFALGAGDRESSPRTDIRRLPARGGRPARRGDLPAVDVEKIVGLGADLVIAGGNSFNPTRGDRPAARPRRPGPRRLRPEPGGRARRHRAHRQRGRPQPTRPTRSDRHDAGRLRCRGGRRPPDCPSRRTFYELDTSTGPIYTAADGSFSPR